ncbi:MAG TPA: biotin/lipoyl-binding protein, partial [Solirubrobacteraceae bacterium]|nr:biotin/lipoyl-binding protein [Solirubrobacteraceae bacterium]
MSERTRASWLVYALGALCVGAIVAAALLVGPASGSQTTFTRTATVARGVVQSTVSGSGNLQSTSQLDLGFKTSGTITAIFVTQGQHVTQGQLLATLDPQSAEVTLEQAKASLQSAEANLAKEEETDGEGSTASAGAGTTTAGAASVLDDPERPASSEGERTGSAPASSTPAASTTPAANATPSTGTTPAASTTPSTSTNPTSRTRPSTSTAPAASTTPSTTRKAAEAGSGGSASAISGSSAGSSQAGSGSSATSATLSAATREADLASARAAVRSDTLTVHSDEQAVQDTKLYAPESGTIVSLSGQVGEVVSASGTTRATSSASTSSSSATAGAAGADTGAGRTSASGAASSSSGSSGTTGSTGASFAVLSDLESMELVAPLSESEIANVKVGQIATVTLEALEGRKLAAHVSEVALTSTSSSGAVSYDVTFQLDQLEPGVKLGMSATAEVVVKQAEGLNVPTSAITDDTVTVLRNGKQT